LTLRLGNGIHVRVPLHDLLKITEKGPGKEALPEKRGHPRRTKASTSENQIGDEIWRRSLIL
jgi:hypothetical protein